MKNDWWKQLEVQIKKLAIQVKKLQEENYQLKADQVKQQFIIECLKNDLKRISVDRFIPEDTFVEDDRR